MFLVRERVQLIINIAVALLLAAFLALGAVMVLPARSPLGSLLGKMASDVDLLSNMLANTEPKAVAQALNENPEFISELLRAMVEEGTVETIAEVVNGNPGFLTAMMPYLDPEAVAYVVNRSGDLVSGLLPLLDPGAIASAVNANGSPYTVGLPGLTCNTTLLPRVAGGRTSCCNTPLTDRAYTTLPLYRATTSCTPTPKPDTVNSARDTPSRTRRNTP